MNTKKILVVGASGMLAGPVIRKLDEAGFDLRLFSRSVKPSMFINDHEIVQGDLFNREELSAAMEGCDAVHISVSGVDDARATAAILEAAKEKGVSRISLVSGCTVAEENRWFPFTDKKFRAEQLLMQSGITWYIFRPTWFFESLSMFVRDGKATMLGKKDRSYHWVAADDLGRMVANAYLGKETADHIYYVYGPEKRSMKELLEKYVREFHPEIKKVSAVPLPVLKMIAFFTRNTPLRFATSLFSYFEKVDEPVVPEEELARLGKAETTFEKWVENNKLN